MVNEELFQGNQIYTVVLSIMLNNFSSMYPSIRSTVKQKVDKINKRLTFTSRALLLGFSMPLWFLSPCIGFIENIVVQW